MKSILSILIIIFWFNSCNQNESTIVDESAKLELRNYASSFMSQLKSILVNEIKSNGIISAFAVCSDTAQQLTAGYGDENNIHIRRVSLKNRNPKNVPDDYEKNVLIRFENLQHENKLNADIEIIEIVTEDDEKYLRYLKPIFIQAECLNCHGKDDSMIKPVKDLIAEKYPDDKAVGYSIGDLRGVVSVKKQLE